jgi:hypothetical protein
MWQPRSPPRLGGRVRCCRARGSVGAHLSREVRPGAIGHLIAREVLPSREVGSRAMGHVAHQSPPLQRGGIRSHMTHGSPGAHLNREAGSSVAGHVAASGSTSVGSVRSGAI